MTIKELAYTAQHHLQASTGTLFKRAHIYELLAAAFGFNSYAALCADAVFTKQSISSRRAADFCQRLRDRCLVIGYQGETASKVSSVLPALMTEQCIGVVTIEDLITHLQDETGYGARPNLENQNEVRWWTSSDELVSPIMLDSLNAAASKAILPLTMRWHCSTLQRTRSAIPRRSAATTGICKPNRDVF